ncbi:MAG: type II secretion system protein [Planctomycetales bacterium]|nr:type II secretion system protein [Planctomycetales bacterium]
MRVHKKNSPLSPLGRGAWGEGVSIFRRCRRGFSLVELLTVMATMSVLLGLAVTTLTLLMRAGQSSTSAVTASLAVSRLAHDFRSDVRAASTADLQAGNNDQPSRLRLSIAAGRVVIYERRKAAIVRHETSGEQSIRTEAYSVDVRDVSFGVPGENAARLVTLSLSSGLSDQAPTRGRFMSAAPRQFQFDAALGADHRFVR